MDDYSIVDFSINENVVSFINSLKTLDQVQFKSEKDNKVNQYIYLFATGKNNIAIFVNKNPNVEKQYSNIILNLEKPLEHPLGLLSAKKLGLVPIEAIDETLVEGEEIKTDLEIKETELSIWDIEYSEEEYRQEIVQELNAIYENRKNGYSLDLETQQILDLIEKTRDIDNDGIPRKSLKKIDGEYRPQAKHILEYNFHGCSIYPIILDTKKYYSSTLQNLDEESKENEDDVYRNYTFLEQGQEMKILIELYKSYAKSKGNRQGFINYHQFIEKLYNGGTIKITNEDGDEEPITFEPINRPFLNVDREKHYNWYSLKLKGQTLAFRHCTPNSPFTINPKTLKEGQQQVAMRLAEGPVSLLKDQLEQNFYTESKGRHGRIKACNGTNKTGDIFYAGNSKTSDFYRSIRKPPINNDLVEGENLIVIGLYIKSPLNTHKNVLGGTEIVDKDTKFYPKIFNSGHTILDETGEYKMPNPDTIKVISTPEEMDWTTYEINYDYMIFFNNNNYKELDNNSYTDVVNSILPSLDTILSINKEKLEESNNFIDIQRLLNFYCMDFREISYDMMKKYNIRGRLVNNLVLARNLAKYEDKKYKQARENLSNFNQFFDDIVDIKWSEESKIVKNIYQIPSQKLNSKINVNITKKVNDYFNSISRETIVSFIKNYLYLEIDTSQNEKKYYINIIISYIDNYINYRFYSNEFYKHFINNGSLINNSDSKFNLAELFDKFSRLYKIDQHDFTRNYYGTIDTTILKQIDFLSKLNKTYNAGIEFYELILINNKLNFKDIVETIIEDYAKKEYHSITGKEWDTARDDEKMPFYPNYNKLKEYNEERKELLTIFSNERKKYNVYNDKCANVKIKKLYNNKTDLSADDSKTIYVDSVFDSIKNDISIFKSIQQSNPGSTIEKLSQILHTKLEVAYIFEVDDEIKYRVEQVLDIVRNGQTDNYKTKIKNGDIAILQTDNKKYLYRRISDYWVPIDKSSYNGLAKCYTGDNKDFLREDYSKLVDICNKECIYENNKNIHNKALVFFKYMEFITTRISNLMSVLLYKENIDTEIYDKLNRLNRFYSYLSYTVEKDKRIREKVPVLEKSKLVYPPKSVIERLNVIRSIADFDLMSSQLVKFIEEFGIPYNRNIDENSTEHKPETSTKYYYDFPMVNVPIVCKHVIDLTQSAYSDNTTKTNVLNSVKRKWGIANAAYISCKSCGEIIDYAKLSEFEGFGKNDKAIRVREKVVDVIDSDVEEEMDLLRLENLLTTEQKEVKKIIDSISKVVNISMRADDIKTIIDKTVEYKKNIYSFGVFYTAILPKVKNPTIINYLENKNLIEDEKKFREDNGTIEESNISILLTTNKYKTLIPVIYGKPPFTNEKRNGPFYLLYNSYVSYNLVLATISFMIHAIINSIPDYYVKGNSIERKTKGQLIKDMFINPDQTINYFSKNLYNLFVANPKEANEFTKSNQFIKNFYGNDVEKELSKIMKEEFFGKFANHQDIIDNYNKKKEYRTELILNEKSKEIDKKYDWNEFLPELKFKETFVYEETSADNLIDNYQSIYRKIEDVNKRIGSLNKDNISNEDIELQRSLADSLVSTLDSIKLIYNKLSYKYISTINDIVFEEDPGNTNPSYYINIIAHYDIGSKYNEYFKQKLKQSGVFGIDDTITILERSLKKIDTFLKSNQISGIKNNIQFLTHSTKARDLQYYMYFDRATSNDVGKVRAKLVEKLKLTHSIINLNKGPLYGTRRMFRELFDNDYKLVVETVAESMKFSDDLDETDIPISKDELESKVKSKIVEKYGDSIEAHLELKLKILFKYNGKAIIDVLSGEIKKEIEDKIEQETKSMSIDELKNRLSSIQIESDRKNIIYKNELAMIEDLEEISPKKLVYSQISNILTKFISIFDKDDDSIGELIENLSNIQKGIENKYNNLSLNDIDTFYNTISDILADYYSFNIEKLDKISKLFSNTTKLSVETIKNKLDRVGRVNNLISEVTKDIPNSLKIEGIYDNSNLEKQFREIRLEQVGYSYEIYNHSILIRYLLEIVSKINNRKAIVEFKKSFTTGKDMNIINSMVFAEKQIFDRILEAIGENNDIVINVDVQAIQDFLISVVGLENMTNPEGNISYCFVSHPKIIRVFTRKIIFYLIETIFNSVDELTEEDEGYLVYELLKSIYNFIDRQDKFTNVTDNDVAEVIKLRRADENIARKDKFKKLSKEDQDTQRIYRQFMLGKKFIGEDGLDIDLEDNRDEQGDNVDRGAESAEANAHAQGLDGQEAADLAEADFARRLADEEGEGMIPIRGENDDDGAESDYEDEQNSDYFGYGRIDDF